MIALMYREGRKQSVSRLMFAMGIAIGWLAFAALLAIPVKHLLIGLATALAGRSLWRLTGMDSRLEFADRVVEWLPIVIPVILIYPYWSMVIYFMGMDAASLIMALVIVSGCLVLTYWKRREWTRLISAVQAASVVIMMLWLAVFQIIEGV